MQRKVTDAGIKLLTPEGIVYFTSTNVPDWAKSVSALETAQGGKYCRSLSRSSFFYCNKL